ncbi:AraC family transcriptional regulator [Chondrinema litorale]|uniref:AraC family transcriptional regulator n=1 Tax=Chondrinema litorale TaxID=2994555 RepID=UPI00254369E7|nr:helix-turn-helix domain-containing protein [Chondrinema litorale]UZR98467.1 helix-turn-helix domain-containing protein [Chondrinema litorale]
MSNNIDKVKAIEEIKLYYRPIQPSVQTKDEWITYQEAKPNKEIESFVYCFWQLKTQETLSQPFIYRVVSDGCIDIFFNHNQASENYIMGFCRKYTEFPIGKKFNYIGIRFLPAAFPLIFGVNAKSLSNQSQELKLILPDFSNWISTKIKSTDSFEMIIKSLNEKLIFFIERQSFKYDLRFFNSLNIIFHKNGFLNIEKDLNTGLSPRQLRRVFNFYVGTTAKTFCNVVRFQHILHAKPSKQSIRNNKLYFDVGFFDQAHFVKNFKTFYGVTPSQAFE